MSHHPSQGALLMVIAGVAFAIINTLTQYLSQNFGLSSTMISVIQYGLALLMMCPWLSKADFQAVFYNQQKLWHLLRIVMAVIGIQFWIYSLAYPIPIWQGIALLMTSPLFATLGSAWFLKEQVGAARYSATGVGFMGAMLILEPWAADFNWITLCPLAAAFFWAVYALMVKKMSRQDTPTTMVIYLFALTTPFNILLAWPHWDWPTATFSWALFAVIGLLTALAQLAVAKAYTVADASFIQPFDHLKLPINVLAGWWVFGWAPPGRLWLGAVVIIGAITFITRYEQQRVEPLAMKRTS
ncbi:MAG: DMT family transporter [Shewanellaceae bacterium]|nr:DMT family transporter [Shewanellaceae bacterium]